MGSYTVAMDEVRVASCGSRLGDDAEIQTSVWKRRFGVRRSGSMGCCARADEDSVGDAGEQYALCWSRCCCVGPFSEHLGRGVRIPSSGPKCRA
jgi:hypothetical protein